MRHLKLFPLYRERNAMAFFGILISAVSLEVIMFFVQGLAYMGLCLILCLAIWIMVQIITYLTPHMRVFLSFTLWLTKTSLLIQYIPFVYRKVNNENVENIYMSKFLKFEADYVPLYSSRNEIINYNKNCYKSKSFFVITPKNYDFKNESGFGSSGKLRISNENYQEYLRIANDKNLILIDATYDNYKFLRQVFGAEIFQGTEKEDVDDLSVFEQILNKY